MFKLQNFGDDEYQKKSYLGHGAWSFVHEYKHKKTDMLYAGKRIVKKYIISKGSDAIENLNMELQTLKEIDHFNIVKTI